MSGPKLTPILAGRPATELSDAELESQGTQAHATRNWVFLHGTAEQFARHTSRMLELEQEYLRRHPHRTWQGSGGASADPRSEAASLREALRAIVVQLDALAAEPAVATHDTEPTRDPVLAVLSAVATAPDGRLHKLEVHQAAREAALDRAALATLYQGDTPALAVEGEYRTITEVGRDKLSGAGRRSTSRPAGPPAWEWLRREDPTWDADVERIVGGAPHGVFDVEHASGDPLPGDWWAAVESDGHVVGFGWMDVGWGEAEILLAVERESQGSGAGSFVLDHLEAEAASRGLNYVYNVVRPGHPQRDQVGDWLTVRGYRGEGDSGPLRKRVTGGGDPSVGAMKPAPEVAHTAAGPTGTVTTDTAAESTPVSSADRGPGHEDAGGYVDVDDHSY